MPERIPQTNSRIKPDGFTLVELMVTATVVGILGGVAMPAYSRYMARSRQAEAKVYLSSIYTAEKMFQVSQGTFTACIYDIGVQKPGTNARYYAVGFQTGGSFTASNCGPSGNADCIHSQYNTAGAVGTACPTNIGDNGTPFNHTAYGSTTSVVKNGNTLYTTGFGDLYIPGSVTGAPPKPYVTNTRFAAIATGAVSTTSIFDRWGIDQTGSITNWVPGL